MKTNCLIVYPKNRSNWTHFSEKEINEIVVNQKIDIERHIDYVSMIEVIDEDVLNNLTSLRHRLKSIKEIFQKEEPTEEDFKKCYKLIEEYAQDLNLDD